MRHDSYRFPVPLEVFTRPHTDAPVVATNEIVAAGAEIRADKIMVIVKHESFDRLALRLQMDPPRFLLVQHIPTARSLANRWTTAWENSGSGDPEKRRMARDESLQIIKHVKAKVEVFAK